MSEKTVLYGFDGSTYVRTVKMVLAEKGLDCDQVQVNVLEGEPREPDHLARHPFGKVPVMDIDGLRIRETDAICRYLEDTHPEPALIPANAADHARMTEAVSLINSYGYDALVGAAGYHLFPDFIGGQDDQARDAAVEDAVKLMTLLMQNRGEAQWLAGERPTLADYFLAPIVFYMSLTPEIAHLEGVQGFPDWWSAIQQLESFKGTEPDLG